MLNSWVAGPGTDPARKLSSASAANRTSLSPRVPGSGVPAGPGPDNVFDCGAAAVAPAADVAWFDDAVLRSSLPNLIVLAVVAVVAISPIRPVVFGGPITLASPASRWAWSPGDTPSERSRSRSICGGPILCCCCRRRRRRRRRVRHLARDFALFAFQLTCFKFQSKREEKKTSYLVQKTKITLPSEPARLATRLFSAQKTKKRALQPQSVCVCVLCSPELRTLLHLAGW